jgi:hypothetical protein
MGQNLFRPLESKMFELPHENEFPAPDRSSLRPCLRRHSGARRQGDTTLRCVSCHENTNNAVTGIPGAPGWHIAPLSMSWESVPGVELSSSALCATFKDKAKNGDRDLDALEHHVSTDPFVLWAWSPGSRPNGDGRLTPPLSHDEFVQTYKEWAADGAPCPTQ